MTIRRKKYLFFSMIVIMSIQLYAQSHFTFASNTGNNMTVLVRTSINPNINGEPLEAGDEIGVFNGDGLCVGAITWNRQNAAITVWGDNDQTDAIDGIAANDTLLYHIWDKSRSKDLIATVTYENEAGLTYAVDRIAKLQTLTVQPTGIRFQEYIVSRINKLDNETVTIFDIRGKIVTRFDGTAGEEGIVERIKKSGLPYGKYLAAIKVRGVKTSKIISLMR